MGREEGGVREGVIRQEGGGGGGWEDVREGVRERGVAL